jgi:hypothetical protein
VEHKQEKEQHILCKRYDKKESGCDDFLNFLLSLHYPPDEIGPGLPPPGGLGTLLLIILILVSLPAQDEIIFFKYRTYLHFLEVIN